MRRKAAIDKLASMREALPRFKVRSLSIFGSVARDDAAEGSDIDLLVEFSKPVGIFEFLRLRRFLEEELGVSVDLATPASLRGPLRERILKEAVRAA